MVAQELWDNVTQYLSSFGVKNAAEAFCFRRTENQICHELLWRAIFKNDNWLELAVSLHDVNPVLVGSDLKKYYNYSKSPTVKKHGYADLKTLYNGMYMVLLAIDFNGDLRYDAVKLFQDLQEHTYNSETFEVSLTCGITLNIKQAVTSCEDLELKTLRPLFNENLRTTYCFWDDPKNRLRVAERQSIIGIMENTTRLEDIGPIVCLRLYHPTQRVYQQIIFEPQESFIYQGPSASIFAIYKDGETYSHGLIQGWQLRNGYAFRNGKVERQ
ncbi:hypothetical protein NA57DRAFT_52770 [Rhizodiscina lignyota]|uniref:Uncharacterized protein n=1 Tax=Rhizodiscina lignyota TaxID=1504668 RepID=A0A9P4ILA9_9PEZI|nr:hypothetical protein NA57DRAFT_52770 [Rhizodiscina lignyota]